MVISYHLELFFIMLIADKKLMFLFLVLSFNKQFSCRWGLGVLIYFMLQGEMPFGSWRENELDTVARIAKGHFNLSHSCSPEATDLITKVLHITLSYLIVDTLSLPLVKLYFSFYYLNNSYNSLSSYLKLMKPRDLETMDLILSKIINGFLELTGKGLQIIIKSPFLMKSFLG